MTLEVRIPISPRPAWLNRVRLIAASLRQWYPDTRFQISAYPPFPPLPGYTWSFPSKHEFEEWAGTRAEYSAQIFDRFRSPFVGDHVLFLDGDVFPVKPFPELFDFDGFSGVQAHVPPWSQGNWCQLFMGFGLPMPDFRYEHTGGGVMCQVGTYGPFYPNSGMMFAPRRHWEALEKPLFEAVEYLRKVLPTDALYWVDQAAFALARAVTLAPARALGLRFNFPNRKSFDAAFPGELRDCRLVHCMDTSTIHRDKDFETVAAYTTLLTRTDLIGSNEILRAAIARIMPPA